MAHAVNFYDNGFDEDGVMRPSRTVKTDDPVEAERLVTEAMARTNSMSAASINVDWRLCDTIEEYIRLGNTCGRWLEENPIEGCYMGQLVEDPEHWAQMGATTPEELEKLILLQSYSDHHKDAYGFRPRNVGMTMDTPIEEIEAAYDLLSGPELRDDDEFSP
jgi:hypothetical protein